MIEQSPIVEDDDCLFLGDDATIIYDGGDWQQLADEGNFVAGCQNGDFHILEKGVQIMEGLGI